MKHTDGRANSASSLFIAFTHFVQITHNMPINVSGDSATQCIVLCLDSELHPFSQFVVVIIILYKNVEGYWDREHPFT
jgi:hypothetical protein